MEKSSKHKEGCGLDVSVLGIQLSHNEKSRASKVNCINNRVPRQTIDLLRTEEERVLSLKQWKIQKDNDAGKSLPQDHFQKQEKEFVDVVTQIERVQKNKRDLAQESARSTKDLMEHSNQNNGNGLDKKSMKP